MRVAVLREPGEIAIEERPRPDPGPGEVLVRVREVGICGSDVHYYEHGRIGDYVVEDPLVLGHESAGEVEAVGDAVDGLDAGDRVALEPGVPCRRCDACRRGDYHLCPDVTFMATPPDDGAFAEYVAWPADYAFELPDDVTLREGALCEPLSVGVHACRRAGVGAGDHVHVAGAGPIGLLTMAVARASGATRVTVSDPIEAKRERARERGADRALAPEESPDGVDVAIEAAGAPDALRGALEAVRRGGTVVVVGLPSQAEVAIDVPALVDDEIDLLGSFRYANTYPAAIELLADDAVDVAGLVDFDTSLAGVPEAMERAQEPDVVKGMVRP